ncbi:MAG: 50S ribosomal protein L25 [Chloroflexi bacterium]|nr:50S ribosomal protein L25 [Chloroflexota bacterium]
MERIELECDTRQVLGKKVKSLRRQGMTPIHLIGHGIDSLSLQCETAQLKRVLSQAGSTRLVDLTIDKTRKPVKVLVRDIQRDPIRRDVVHVDLYQVRMEEKVRVEVPLVLVGEAPALGQKGTSLSQELTRLNIECLPGAIPDRLEVDISSLVEPDQAIHVKDIPVGAGIEVADHPDQLVVRISVAHVVEEEEKVAAKEAEAVPTAAEGAETTEEE